MRISDHGFVVLVAMWQAAGSLHAGAKVACETEDPPRRVIPGWEKWKADYQSETVNGCLFRADPPSEEDAERNDADQRKRFISEFGKHPGCPEFRVGPSDRAWRVEIYGVPDTVVQDEVLGMVQRAVDKSLFEPVMIEFIARRQGGPQSDKLEKNPNREILRRKLVRKRPVLLIGNAVSSGEIAPKPPMGDLSEESFASGIELTTRLQKLTGVYGECHSHTRGHSITYKAVAEEWEQGRILRIARELVDEGGYGMVYIEFVDPTRRMTVEEGGRTVLRPRMLRSRVLTAVKVPEE